LPLAISIVGGGDGDGESIGDDDGDDSINVDAG
jgi:hypothetical protein